MNRVLLLDQVTEARPKLTWTEGDTPYCIFTPRLDEAGKDSALYELFVPVNGGRELVQTKIKRRRWRSTGRHSCVMWPAITRREGEPMDPEQRRRANVMIDAFLRECPEANVGYRFDPDAGEPRPWFSLNTTIAFTHWMYARGICTMEFFEAIVELVEELRQGRGAQSSVTKLPI